MTATFAETVIEALTDVWTAIIGWVTSTIPNIVAVFYDASTGLTFLGVLALVALGISVFFLLMGVRNSELHP